jgi:RimJ/RimL family protein N-acetyltransferase
MAGMLPIKFEPLDTRHRDGVVSLVSDADVLRFTRIPEPTPPGFASEWIQSYVEGRAVGTREGFAAIGEAGEFLGLGLAPEIDSDGRELELGYIVAPSARGRGIARAILTWITGWAFSERQALRAYLIIDCENSPSHRVAERCGYRREGVVRSIHLKQGRRIDAALWSKLPTDHVVPAPDRRG